jgi:hypothetical protein
LLFELTLGMEFASDSMGLIQGPIIATASILINIMVWMILVIVGAFLDMKNEEMVTIQPY